MMKERYSREKENVILRLQLVGGFFSYISRKPFVENWAVLLLQMCIHGVISPNYERYVDIFLIFIFFIQSSV